MRFATAVAAFEQQPSLWLFGEMPRGVVSLAEVPLPLGSEAQTLGQKVLKGHVRQERQAARLAQIF